MFKMSRYKFVSKMLSGRRRVLEIGCGDAFPIRIVQQEVEELCAVDIDPVLVKDVNDRMDNAWPFECKVHDILEGPVDGPFDAAYSLDMIEHVPVENEQRFMQHAAQSLTENGVLLLGTPSMQSQGHASADRKAGLVNSKTQQQLRVLMRDYFHNVFMFSMNDEVAHTGYAPMSHYVIAMGVGNKVVG
jgi:cyclopropane fatty-acyl-phospholipid synthase-like methyltransferase